MLDGIHMSQISNAVVQQNPRVQRNKFRVPFSFPNSQYGVTRTPMAESAQTAYRSAKDTRPGGTVSGRLSLMCTQLRDFLPQSRNLSARAKVIGSTKTPPAEPLRTRKPQSPSVHELERSPLPESPEG